MKNILKEIGKASLYALVAQFIAWSIFIFIDETWTGLSRMTLFVIMAVIFLLISILYFFVMRHEKDLCIYNMKRFKATFLIVWSFLSVAVSRIIIDMVQAGTFHKCTYDCYIPLGAEFYLFGHLAIFLVLFILFFEGINLLMKGFNLRTFLFEETEENSYPKENKKKDLKARNGDRK